MRVGLVNNDLPAEPAQALGVLAASQMAFASVRPQNFSVGADLEPLRH
jgi:hypothetical protein